MKTVIISLGGSTIVPDKIDIEFLKKFKAMILDFIKKGNKAVIVTGGGHTCRVYQNAAKKLAKTAALDGDWIGIIATRLNAELVRVMFKEHAYEKVIYNPTEKIHTDKPIIIGAGYVPGHSTDNDCVLFAKNLGADTVVNMFDLYYVYTKDPKKFKDAKPLKQVSWDDYIKIIGEKWLPGRHTPFDPVASKNAQKLGLKVIIIKGTDLNNFKKMLNGKKFKGTVIK